MASRNKLSKFNDLLNYPHVYENYDPREPRLIVGEDIEVKMKGKWNSDHFKNDHPLILELACGRGEYTLALAEAYPNKNFIGVDIKGARIWQGATEALENNMDNVAFLRTRIEQLDLFFDEGEIDEIWITFPDPFLRKSKSNRRLTSNRFLDMYTKLVKQEGYIHLKTDSQPLYEFSLDGFESHPHMEIQYYNDNIYSGPLQYEDLSYKTYYERMHLEKSLTIKYIRVQVNKS